MSDDKEPSQSTIGIIQLFGIFSIFIALWIKCGAFVAFLSLGSFSILVGIAAARYYKK